MSDGYETVRILLVDDDANWRKRLERSLPEYKVDSAGSYGAALDLLRPGMPYDVAIVDLNLIPPGQDELGGSILDKLRAEYPSTRRIGLTGLAPGAVRALLDRYDLDDLLLKASMQLSDVRSIVKLALGRTLADVPNDVKAGKWQLLDDLRTFQVTELKRLEMELRSRKRDLSDAERAGMTNEEAAGAIRVLEAERSDLKSACSALQAAIASAHSSDEIALVSQEFLILKHRSEAALE